MSPTGTPFEEHQDSTDQASTPIDGQQPERYASPAALASAADRLLRRGLFGELVAVTSALRRLTDSPQTWSAEGAADLYDQRARLWADLAPLVPRKERALFLAVVVAETADGARAEELRAIADELRRAS
jgi:hypothetical protein